MKNKKIIFNILCILIVIQPVFDALIYYLRVVHGLNSLVISMVRPCIVLITFLYLIVCNKVSKKEKIFFFIYLILYLIFGVVHLFNIKGYLYYDVGKSLINELRYIMNCGYYLMLLVNFRWIFKIISDENKKKIIKSVVYAIILMCILYFVSIITKTSGMTYPLSVKAGYKGWSISAHYIGHCCLYGLPIMIYAKKEKKYMSSWLKYIFILMPIIISYYFIGTKAPYFGVLALVLVYTLFKLVSIVFKKIKINLDCAFWCFVSIILVCTFTKTLGYSNFHNQVDMYNKDITNNYTDIHVYMNDLDVNNMEDIKDDNEVIKEKENNIFQKRLDITTEHLVDVDYAVFDTRVVQLKYNSYLRNISPTKDKLFGYGYFTMTNNMMVETDVFGIFYCFGLVGFLLIIVLPLLYIILLGFLCLFDFKNLNRSKLLLGCSFGLSIGIITFVGYTMMFSQTVFYLVFLFTLCCYEFNKKDYKDKRKYLFVINDLNVGGAEVGLVDTVNELAKNDTVDIVLLRKEGTLLNKLNNNVRVYEILNKDYSKIKQKFYHILYFMGGPFTKYVYRNTVDTEYEVEIAYIEGYPAVFIANSTNSKSLKVASIRVGLKRHKLSAEKIPFGKLHLKNAYLKIDKIYTVSEETTKEFIEKYPFAKSKTSTIYTYFNKENINKEGNKKINYVFDKNYVNFLAVGRFSEQKSYDRLIEAFNKLSKKYDNVKLHFVGKYDTDYGKKVIKMIKDYNLDDRVIFHGVQDNPYAYMKNADVIVSSSLYEGYPRVICEALCLKKLCIGTNVTGTKEALANGKGILVDDSIDGIYNGMADYLNNPNIYDIYRENIELFDGNKKIYFEQLKNITNRKPSLAIFISRLSYGGLEKALVNLINIAKLNDKYDVTLYMMYKGNMNYVNLLPNNINLQIASPNGWNIFGKIRSIFYILYLFIYLLINKYDCSICYTHHHPLLAKLSRVASSHNVVFIHSNILAGTNKKQRRKYRKCNYNKFETIVCVSYDAKQALNKFLNEKTNAIVINNLIDGNEIISKSSEKTDFVNEKGKKYFIHVGRHDESVKKISRIIKATKRLNEENYKFEVLLVGDGKDDKEYEMMLKQLKINNIHLLGKKENPYGYMKNADALVLSSLREGYPVVFVEAMILGLPIITTDVSDAKVDVDNKYGYVVENNDDAIYEGMKKFLDSGFKIKNRFDFEVYNNNILEEIEKIIG